MGIEIGGLFGLIILVLNIWAIVNIFQSSASAGAKTFWVVFVLIFPLIGLIFWFFFGPKSAKAR